MIRAAAEAESQPALTPAWSQFLRCEVGRHPDLLKLGCNYLFQALAEEGDVFSPEEIVEAVRSDFRYDTHARWLCERLYARRTEEERAILASVASGRVSGDPILLRRLERKLGLVELACGQPALFADACRYWIARHRLPRPPWRTTCRRRLSDPLTITSLNCARSAWVSARGKLSAVEDRLFRYS